MPLAKLVRLTQPLRQFAQTVLLVPENPARASVQATIDCTTINTGEPRRCRSDPPGFFDVKRYPTINCKSKKVEAAGPERLKRIEDLTINAKEFGILNNPIMEAGGVTAAIQFRSILKSN